MKLKALALVAAVLMTASCFAACTKDPAPSSSDQPSNSDESSSDESSSEGEDNTGAEHQQIQVDTTPVTTLDYKATSIDTSEPVELLFYQYDEIKTDSEEVFAKLNEMSAADINTTVDFQWADGTKGGLIISTDEPYDMIFSCSWQNNYMQNAAKGAFAELDEALPKAAPTLWNFIPENVWNGTKFNGHIYCVPNYKDVAAAQMWKFDKSLVEDAGVTEAELDATGADPNSITPILEKIAKTDMEGATAPYMLGTAHYLFNQEFDYINRSGAGIGVPYTATERKVMSVLEDPNTVRNMKALAAWNKAGLINKDATTLDTEPWTPVGLGQGWLGCEPLWKNNDHGEVVIRTKNPAVYTVDSAIGACNAISYQSENVERALLWFQWINCNNTARDIYCYGIEGKHWNKTAEGVIERTEEGNTNYRVSAFSQGSFFTMTPEVPNTADVYLGLLQSCVEAPVTVLQGFAGDASEVETQIASVDTVWTKYQRSLNCGVYEDVDAQIATILEELRGAGLDEIIAEYQSQVDEFYKDN